VDTLVYLGYNRSDIQQSSRESSMLVGFADFDWARNSNDWKSNTRCVFNLGIGPVMWDCKKQNVLSLSSTKKSIKQ
jgi:hypothetical protein